MLLLLSVVFLVTVQDGSSRSHHPMWRIATPAVGAASDTRGPCYPKPSCGGDVPLYPRHPRGHRVSVISYLEFADDGGFPYYSYEELPAYEGKRCVMYHNRAPGVCTPLLECQSALIEYTKRQIFPTLCSTTSGAILVCCSDSSIPDAALIADLDADYWAAIASQADDNRYNERNSEEDEDYSSEEGPGIIGGENTLPKEFPHMAALGYLNMTDGYEFYCGGSLISPRFVLTAGHCTKSTNTMLKNRVPEIVRLGDQNLDPSESDNAEPIEVHIKTIHKHPKYDPPKTYHDIALIELDEDVKFTDAIKPACLWREPGFQGYTEAIATGWGATNKHDIKYSNELMKVSLTLMSNKRCNKLKVIELMKNRNWSNFTDEQLCAGDFKEERDTCQGDSGGPLQVEEGGGSCKFYVMGVTSFSKFCAQPGWPGVYTRVSSYVDWIESITGPLEE